jgi:[ribosomal protein S5]-alanine N-acetyltransferase
VTPELVTPRLVLRPFTAADGDDLHAMDCDDRVMRYLAHGLVGRTREESDRALTRIVEYARAHPGFGLWHARRCDDGTFVGGCGLYPLGDTGDIEIAYRLPFACWGHGYATEMARAVVEFGLRELGLPRIVGVAWPENVESQRVLRKIGMREQGTAVHYGRTMHVFVAERQAPA